MDYFVLWCEEDTSYSLVGSSSVVYEDSVALGDKVKFFIRTKEYLGEVRGMGSDYDEMKALQDRLNAQNKAKPGSFHAERKRSITIPSRLIEQESSSSRHADEKNKLSGRKGAASSGKTHSKYEGPSSVSISINKAEAARKSALLERVVSKARQKSLQRSAIQKQRANADVKDTDKMRNEENEASTLDVVPSGSSIQDDVILSSSEEDLTPQERALYEKMKEKEARRKAKMDKRALRNMEFQQEYRQQQAIAPASSKTTQKEDKEDSPPDAINEKSLDMDENTVNRGDTPEVSDEESSDSNKEDDKPPTPKKRHSSAVDKSITYEGNQLLYEDPNADKTKFDELKGSKGKRLDVYCTTSDLLKARRLGKTATAYARKLLVGVFTPDALENCTVSGDLYKAGGKEKQFRKPKLNEKAVEAIIAASIARQERKKWSPTCDTLSIKNSLRQKLVDKRQVKKPAAIKEDDKEDAKEDVQPNK